MRNAGIDGESPNYPMVGIRPSDRALVVSWHL